VSFRAPGTVRKRRRAAGVGLFQYLVERGRIRQLDNFDRDLLHIYSRDVLRRIKDDDRAWEEMVSAGVADVIKRRRFFNYRERNVPAKESGA
jgi:hypothetical protein